MVLMLAGLLLGLASVRSRTVSGTPLADSQAQCASAQLTAVSAQWRRADVFGVRDSRIFHAHLNPDAPAKREVTYFAGGKAEGKKVQWRPTAIASLNETGRVDVFYTTEDFQLYHKWLDGDTFQPDASDESLGENLNGSFRATVSATSFKPNQIDLIAQGGHDVRLPFSHFPDSEVWALFICERRPSRHAFLHAQSFVDDSTVSWPTTTGASKTASGSRTTGPPSAAASGLRRPPCASGARCTSSA